MRIRAIEFSHHDNEDKHKEDKEKEKEKSLPVSHKVAKQE
jgi:hypothetical protein